MSETFAQPYEITHNGQTYPVHLISGEVREQFEKKYFSRAVERLRDRKTRDGLSRKEYLDELRLLDVRQDKGEFAFLSEGSLNTMLTTSWGQKTIYGLLMPGVPKEVVAALLKDRSDDMLWLLERVIRASFPTSVKKQQEQEEFEEVSREDPLAPKNDTENS